MKTQRVSGFTLIELLVAITILAILTVVGLSAFQSAQRSSRDARRKADLQQIKTAVEMYIREMNPSNGFSVFQLSGVDSSVGNFSAIGNCVVNSWAANGVQKVEADFMNKLPNDPKNNCQYFYAFEPIDSKNAWLGATLENLNDKEINGDVCKSNFLNSVNYCVKLGL